MFLPKWPHSVPPVNKFWIHACCVVSFDKGEQTRALCMVCTMVMPKSRRISINVEIVLDTFLVLSVDQQPTRLDVKSSPLIV